MRIPTYQLETYYLNFSKIWAKFFRNPEPSTSPLFRRISDETILADSQASDHLGTLRRLAKTPWFHRGRPFLIGIIPKKGEEVCFPKKLYTPWKFCGKI